MLLSFSLCLWVRCGNSRLFQPVRTMEAISQLQHNAALRVEGEVPKFRANKIICTIGPKTQTVEALEGLIDAGMNVARMNFSHGSYEFHGETVKNAREAARRMHSPLAVALDTKGPEIG